MRNNKNKYHVKLSIFLLNPINLKIVSRLEVTRSSSKGEEETPRLLKGSRLLSSAFKIGEDDRSF